MALSSGTAVRTASKVYPVSSVRIAVAATEKDPPAGTVNQAGFTSRTDPADTHRP
jgi:hypothetical protein